MKKYKFFLLFFILFSSCTKTRHQTNAKVFIGYKNHKYTLYRDGKPYLIKGASGGEHLDVLVSSGGNTIRIWDTTQVNSILKKANEQGIAVIVGLPIPESRYMDYYNDPIKVAKQFNAIKLLVNKLKSNPALLMWCLGNELTFPYKPAYYNFYKAFNHIVTMIHHDDPDHPVTTTMVNFQRSDIFMIKTRTDIDLISFNIFGHIHSLKEDLDNFSWLWNGPFLVTEWGIDGPWEGTPQTSWSAKIEPTSTKKAEQYLNRYKDYMPVESSGFLGSFIFYWGQKQEVTHTWFSLFDENGKQTESIGSAQVIWTGKNMQKLVPKIKYMLLDQRGAADNIILKPDEKSTAEVLMQNQGYGNLIIKWEIYPEDWYKKNNINNIIKPAPVMESVVSFSGFKVMIKTPRKEGPYRIFAAVYDSFGHVATCNTPFYVMAND